MFAPCEFILIRSKYCILAVNCEPVFAITGKEALKRHPNIYSITRRYLEGIEVISTGKNNGAHTGL